ncbi:MAG: heat-inducible transcriptional repressor HrcA [Prosthecochloris sp.]|uniref:Heat-inducible transcription repressor HrcA n=1 Tax=Prosthecochloris aestuarii (strain DSM 271 / SK 413) TaxID=290512 RepID=HRCA_PROA2|nr:MULTISPECIES: heat-inducible transcriptional repressor HrcA [Prosthecochloris]B4S9D2.1 RecName: Full=Heat-inducible transcription repressor HrcA [Prosthecochloris aestuarii DSM 271]ACF46602.1 heat-inducible transcription repressor HrcA [Prosthecochloris aestuarii DSM 271]MCW8797546.1 heat-inducible transcriptional repressor HrcA [Prosthecochloris sp.]NEX12067.1 HrcA family transcriptional regulator [Prosthecochloris sp.]RDD29853.1 HrcA family transcriptional regulator [Prosthecochloris sp. 
MKTIDLTPREREVLGIIIQAYVVSASPVSSRFIAKNYNLGLSDATIRNVMADLEDAGFISQPHTSAGRVPTDKGYRYYVDLIMMVQGIDDDEKRHIDSNLRLFTIDRKDSSEVLFAAAKVLGSISQQLSVVMSPRLSLGVFERLDMVLLSSSRIMVILSIQSLFVKTIVMELDLDVSRRQIEMVVDLLNQRLSGLTLDEIRTSIAERLADCDTDQGLLNRIVRSADELFDESPVLDRLYIAGAEYIVSQPEFDQPQKVRDLICMIEDKTRIARIVDLDGVVVPQVMTERDVSITIGRENPASTEGDFTVVTTPYFVGNTMGRLAVLGPKRMDYARVVRVVNYMADRLSTTFSDVN